MPLQPSAPFDFFTGTTSVGKMLKHLGFIVTCLKQCKDVQVTLWILNCSERNCELWVFVLNTKTSLWMLNTFKLSPQWPVTSCQLSTWPISTCHFPTYIDSFSQCMCCYSAPTPFTHHNVHPLFPAFPFGGLTTASSLPNRRPYWTICRLSWLVIYSSVHCCLCDAASIHVKFHLISKTLYFSTD